MDNYLKGRPKAQKLQAKIPAQKTPMIPAHENFEVEREQVVEAEPAPDAVNAPKVDLVLRDGIVRRIIIHLEDGRNLELECVYEDEE